MKSTIFIDGEVGTTGLQIRARLEGRSDLDFIRLSEADRKNPAKRREALNHCDLAILCLPDDAAREAVTLVDNPKVRILDASSAHRTTAGWVYGLPELSPSQPDRIAKARLVTNPGCYPTGAILLLKPLIDRGLLPKEYAVSVNAISGYSGAGKSLIEEYEKPGPDRKRTPYSWYSLKLEHKHVEEMRVHSGLQHRPIFTPSYGAYRQGIVLQIPLQLWTLSSKVGGEELRAALADYYRDAPYLRVLPAQQLQAIENVEPESLNGTNDLNIYAFHNDKHRQAVLAAVYDNLGKGASGAAVQNMNLMLGLSELGNLDLSRQAMRA